MKLLSIFLIYSSLLYGQTRGIGEVNSVESKAQQIIANRNKISENKINLGELELVWQDKIKKLKKELEALITERDNIIADMKVGARCSQCQGWKSEFEKKGINFEKHLGEVKGYAIPATTSELESTRTKYKELIAYKKVQIQNMEKVDNAVTRMKEDIARREKENETFCSEITAHSKNYEKLVVAESEPMQKAWIEEIMEHVARKHIEEDKLEIGKYRLQALERQFRQQADKSRDDEKTRTEAEKTAKQDKIRENDEKIKEEEQSYKQSVGLLEEESSQIKTDRDKIATALKVPGISKEEMTQLSSDMSKHTAQIQLRENQKNTLTSSYSKLVESLKADNRILALEANALTTGLPKRQENLAQLVKVDYEKQKAAINQKIRNATASLAEASTALNTIIAVNWRKESEYHALVVKESDRMTAAGQSVGCAIHKDVRFIVAGNYSRMESCANGFKHANQRTYPSSGIDCIANFKGYTSIYKPWARSLDSEEVAAIQKSTYWIWFEAFYK